MINFLAQMILAQRDVEDNGWMNILVVIVMIVFWMVGGIIKAMKTKSDQQQQPSRVPARKRPAPRRAATRQQPAQSTRPPASTRQPQQGPANQPRRTTLAELRAAARKFAAEAEQAFQPPAQKAASEHRQPLPKPEPATISDETVSTEPVVESVKSLGDERAKLEARLSASQLQFTSDLLSDYADPDKLRRAILHYEILGPPLSLRD